MDENHKRQLQFPRQISDALAQFAECVSSFGFLEDAALGGGTVLAARWHHRQSTDLDFFVRQSTFAETIARRESDLRDVLREVAFGLTVTPHHMQCVVRDTSVEISVSVTGHETAIVPETSDEAGYGIATQTTTAILVGKMAGRMMRQGRATARDIYDLCVAERMDRDALLAAAATVPPGALRRTADFLPEELAGNQCLKPLLAPTHADIAEDLATHGGRLLLRLCERLEELGAAPEPTGTSR